MQSSQHKKLSDSKNFAQRLDFVIRNKGATASAVAEAVGVNRGYISFLRSGKRENPSREIIEGIASFLDINVDWLLSGSGKMEATPNKKVHSSRPEKQISLPVEAAAKIVAAIEKGTHDDILSAIPTTGLFQLAEHFTEKGDVSAARLALKELLLRVDEKTLPSRGKKS